MTLKQKREIVRKFIVLRLFWVIVRGHLAVEKAIRYFKLIPVCCMYDYCPKHRTPCNSEMDGSWCDACVKERWERTQARNETDTEAKR